MAIDTPGDMRLLADFAQYLTPDDTPFTASLGGPPKPVYYYPTTQKPVFPLFSYWSELNSILADIRDNMCGDDEWGECEWRPSEEYTQLENLAIKMKVNAFKTVINPDYDPVRAAEWDAEHPPRRPLDQQKIVWGTGYVIPTEGGKFVDEKEDESGSNSDE